MLISVTGLRAMALQVAYSLGLTLEKGWTDKAADVSVRLVAWRLWNKAQADRFAAALQQQLVAGGWTNEVKRTSCVPSYASRASGGEYVRVRAQSTTGGWTVLE